jgi:hypothetical protein
MGDDAGGYKFGVTASGIPFLAGLLTVDELRRGAIDHILGLALPETLAGRWSYPAQRTDGESHSADAIPEGTIFRLPANLDLDAVTMDPFARMIAKAVQKHGMIIWDISGVVCFRAENPANRYPEGHPYAKERDICAVRLARTRPIQTIRLYTSAGRRLGFLGFLGIGCKRSKHASQNPIDRPPLMWSLRTPFGSAPLSRKDHRPLHVSAAFDARQHRPDRRASDIV